MVDPVRGPSNLAPVVESGQRHPTQEYAIHFGIDGVPYSFYAYPTPEGPDVSGEPGRYIMVWVQNPASIDDGGVWLNFPSLEPGVHAVNEIYINTFEGHYSSAHGKPGVQMVIEQASDGLLRATLQGRLESTQEPGKEVALRAELTLRIPNESQL